MPVNPREVEANAKNKEEITITTDEVRAAAKPPLEPTTAPMELLSMAQKLLALHLKWQQESAGLGIKPQRRYVQVLTHVEAFRLHLTLGELTRKLVAD